MLPQASRSGPLTAPGASWIVPYVGMSPRLALALPCRACCRSTICAAVCCSLNAAVVCNLWATASGSECWMTETGSEVFTTLGRCTTTAVGRNFDSGDSTAGSGGQRDADACLMGAKSSGLPGGLAEEGVADREFPSETSMLAASVSSKSKRPCTRLPPRSPGLVSLSRDDSSHSRPEPSRPGWKGCCWEEPGFRGVPLPLALPLSERCREQ
uniref:Uncharacterized protein n=1 Tax=Ixodes ricinus TaxID=34613 RepID=A0A6B0V396_IXORI